ncbi:MAG: ABC transporter permease [Deltaproteobacteria bacterium]|nr:ABC transporter permease [Deltaproteobacteria bacterium]
MGRGAESVARHAGNLAVLLGNIVRSLLRGGVRGRDVLNEAYLMGVQSLPLVLLTATLAGIVTSQQGGYQFTGSVPLYVVGSVVGSSIILELGPILTAIVIIGRVGARNTAQIGTMQVSEQIDALYSLGRDPVRSLAAPRLLASVMVMPVLVGLADTVGLFSGMITAGATLHLGAASFLYGVRIGFHPWDLLYSLCKALVFGFVIPLISVHMGLLTHGGAEGVGRATTASVVFMIIAVLVVDALFPPLMLG